MCCFHWLTKNCFEPMAGKKRTRREEAKLYAGLEKGRVGDALDLPDTDTGNFTW